MRLRCMKGKSRRTYIAPISCRPITVNVLSVGYHARKNVFWQKILLFAVFDKIKNFARKDVYSRVDRSRICPLPTGFSTRSVIFSVIVRQTDTVFERRFDFAQNDRRRTPSLVESDRRSEVYIRYRVSAYHEKSSVNKSLARFYAARRSERFFFLR